MELFAQIVGLAAVIAFLLCYQQKKRRDIIILNFISRCLYVLQYLLLGAFSGALFDILGAIASAFAGKDNAKFIKRHLTAIVMITNICILTAGIAIAYINRSFIDLFALGGILFEINALWLKDERAIRWVSLLSAPFWFTYNFISHAYGSAIGNALVIISIITALIRYKKREGVTQ